MTNMRKKKNYIHSLQIGNTVALSQQEKQDMVYNHFLQHIGADVPRSCLLNFDSLGWQPRELSHLDQPFSEEEIHTVIKNAPKEKAPGPNDFIGIFLSSCWDIIKQDFISAIQQFFVMNQQNLHLLNPAFVVLIPKISNPSKVSDFRPISLTHTFSKTISKLLANRLGPELDNLISINQTAFIKKRCIHDNFIYLQEVIKDLHKKRISALFLKLDISKAFDSVSWPYLLDVMEYLGFGQSWRNWVSSLWGTASSSFLVNGMLGKRILHCRGVRQGDPLSPMLFLLAMEPLHRLFQKAQDLGLLDSLSASCDTFRMSPYADAAATFVNPTEKDMKTAIEIMHIFESASGLKANMSKTECFPIQCASTNLHFLDQFNLRISHFPCRYLGLPLHFRKPTREMIEPFIQKIGNRLLGWQRGLFSYPGRELLVKSVLSAMPTFFLTAFKMPKWAFAKVDRIRRSFLWKGKSPGFVRGGHCLINWQTCLRPRKWGGLGIKDLEKFSRALRMC
jgi:hypothetical protein